MADLHPTLRELAAGLTLATGQKHKVVVPKLDVDTIEMEDIHFHHNSDVVLPWGYGEETGLDDDQDRLSGISVIAAALRYAKDNPSKKLLLAGHTDSSGESDYNRKLSEARAKTTKALLTDDKSGWGSLCVEHQTVEDLQQTLLWVAATHGWPCNPGPIDDTMGPKTQAARRAFRKRYNDEFSASLPLDAEETSAQDWEAFFDLFDLGLQDELGDDLSACRSALSFYSPDILACGEDFAEGDNSPAGMRSVADRRVDMLFLDPSKPYPDFFSEKPPGNSIYGPVPLVKRRYLPVAPPVQLALKLTAIEGLYPPGFKQDGDVAPKASGYNEGYLSEDDLGRVFVNHKPRTDPTQAWDDVVTKDTQYIELEASVELVQGPKIPPEARVQWEWFDPNDKDHPDTNAHGALVPDQVDVDGRARSMLNRGTCDFPKPGSKDMARFGQAGDFGFADAATVKLADTQITDGTSRVRLHVSNVAGDNFVVVARLKNSPRVAPSGQVRTGVMTVWKRIDVEYVKMAGAFSLPVDQVPPFFEPARVQMDFAPERPVPSQHFLTKLDKDKESACAMYATASNGEFKLEGKPGWFFLAAAERCSSENASSPSDGGPKTVYRGKARVAQASGGGENWEKLVVDQVITDKVAIVTVHDVEGGPRGFQPIWKKQVTGNQTHLHLWGIDYQSDFEVPRGQKTGLLGAPGKGGAYDKTDNYYLQHRFRYPSSAWEPGGMGFADEVFIKAAPPGTTETTGLSPSARFAGQEYFAGRLLIFTRAFEATSLDADDVVSTIVHEFTHAFGYPHKCGYYGWPQPPEFSCSMNYFLTWIYKVGTRELQRFFFGTSGGHLCSKHLSGVREVNLEDNPAIWKWSGS
ncbi:MAG TPA: OmpA family protein [Polyangia bacterium]|nr:OmpA family protein [Polyangia bacterium]